MCVVGVERVDGTCNMMSGVSDLFRIGHISVVARQFVQAQLGRSPGGKAVSGSKVGRMDI